MDWKAIAIMMFAKAVQEATPEIRARLCGKLKDFEKDAKTSANPWDDILAFLLITLVACD